MQKKRIVAVVVLASLLLIIAALLFWYSRAEAPAIHPSTPASSTPTQPTFDKKQYSTTDPSSPWVIVNKQHPITPQNYTPGDLTSVGNGQQMRAEAATALQQLFAGAASAGYSLVADSGYRSYATQVSTYNGYVKTYGQAYTDTVSAHPGYSEHQTGWAVDIGSGSCHVTDCFGSLPAGQWAQAHAYEYGFVLRYTQADSSITGYSAEAWHFRYVGTTLSTELHNQNITTLEQFFDVTGGAAYL